MAKKGSSFIPNIPGQILYIGKEVAKDYFSDYTENITTFINDAKEVGDQLTQGKSKVVDIVADIKQNGGKKALDWFMQRSDESDEYGLLNGGNDSDFDAGFQVGEGDGDGEQESPSSKIADEESMKDIARGQVNAMYQIGAKQAEASMINAAEIVSHIDGRASEIVTSLNNMNKSIIGIGEKIDALGKLLQTQTQIEEEQMKAQNQSAIDSHGRVTLGSWFNQMKSNVKDAATNNIVAQMLSMGKDALTPAGIISMLLSDTKDKKTGKVGAAVGSGIDFLTELIGGKQTNFSEKFANNSLNTIGSSFNNMIGDAISNVLLGGNKKLNDALGKIPFFGDMLSEALNKGLTLKSSTVGEYQAEIKNEYNRDKAVFDGITRQSITEIIPGYLKVIAQSMTGVAWDHANGHVSQHGSRNSQERVLDAALSSNITAINSTDHQANINKDLKKRSGVEAGKINDTDLEAAWNEEQTKLEQEASNNGQTYTRKAFDVTAKKQMREKKRQQIESELQHRIKTKALNYQEAFSSAVLIRYMGDPIEVKNATEFQQIFDWETIKSICTSNPDFGLAGDDDFNTWFNSLRLAINNPESGANIFTGSTETPGTFMADVFKILQSATEADIKRKNDDAAMGRASKNLTKEDIINSFKNNAQVRTAQTNINERRDAEIARIKETDEYKEQEKKYEEANKSKLKRGSVKDPNDWAGELADKNLKKNEEQQKDVEIVEKDKRAKAGIIREDIDATKMSNATKVSKTETAGISADFETNLFGKLEGIISAINHLNVKNTTGSGNIPSILNNIYGRGDDKKAGEETSKEDEIISDTATKMAQTQASDGDLASDLPFLKRITSQMKNKGLGNKLSQMFTMWGTNMKNSIKNKVNGALSKSPLGSAISKYILPAIGVIGAWIKKKLGAAFRFIGQKVLTPALNLVKKGMKSGMNDVKKGWTQIWGTQEEREKRKEEREKRAEAKKAQKEERRAQKRAEKEAKALAKAAEKGTREGSEKGSKEGVKAGTNGGSGGGFFSNIKNKFFKKKGDSEDGTTTSDPTIGAPASGGVGALGGILRVVKGIGSILKGFGKMILTAIASLTAVKAIMDLVQKTLTTAVKPLNKAFKKLTGTIKKLLKAVGDSIKYIANLVVKLVDSLMPVLNVLVDLVGDLLGGIIGALDPILNVLTGLIDVLVGPINMILDLVMDVVGPVLTAIGTIVESIGDILEGVLTPILQAVGSLIGALMPILNPLLNLTTMLINWYVTDGPLGKFIDGATWLLTKVANILGIIAGGIQGAIGGLQMVLGKILEGIGTVIDLMPFTGSAGKKIKQAGTDMFNASEETLEGAKEQIDSSVGALTGKNKETKSDASASGLKSDQSNAIATPIPSTGGTMDSIRGSGDTYSEDQRYNPIETFGPFLEAIWNELHKTRTVQEETVEPSMENSNAYQEMMLGNVTKHINKQMMMASKVFIPMYASFKTDVVPTLESIESLTKLSIGNNQAYYGQQLAADALQLVAAGSTAAGAALFQTSIGLSASGMAYQAEGVTSKANQVSYLTTGQPFYISSLYPDATDTTTSSEIAEDNTPVANETSNDPTNNTNTNTTVTIPTIPVTTTSASGYRDYFGSGDSQGRYGSYLNMSQRGCGPVALADAANRRGGNVNAGALASSMASSGSYSSSRGTSVGGFIDTAASMGMGYQVGGVTSQSLNRATPNNPVTLVGSGAGFGTRSGNTHYINVVGTDHAGGAYVSNPLSGRVERRSANELASSSVVGLYGSGDVRGANAAWYHLYGAGPSGYYTFTKTTTKHFYDELTSDEKTVIDNMWNQSDPVSWKGDKWNWLASQLNDAKITASNINQVLPAIKAWLKNKRAEFVLNTLNRNKYGQVEDPREVETAKTAAIQSIYSHNKVTITAATAKAQLTAARRRVLEPLYQQYLAMYMQQNPSSNPPSIEEFFANSASEALEALYKDYVQDYMSKNPSSQPPTFDSWYSNSKNWSWSKIFNKIKDANPLLQNLESGTSGNSEIADTAGTAGSLGTTSGTTSITAPPGGSTGYISTEQKLSADANPSVIPKIEGDSFSERIKNAMSGLTGIFSNILKMFSANEDSEVEESVKEAEEKRVEKVIREAVGNEEYERYASQAYELLRQNNPKAATETDEHYEARIKSMWENESIKRKYLNAVAKNNANIMNAMKVNGMVDASEGSMSSIYGEYDAETGTWSGGMLNAALGQGGGIVESSYNDPYAGKFVSDGGAVMWTDAYQPTIFDTDITEDGGTTLSKSPVHEFFWQTSGASDTTGATQYAFSQNGGWYTRRSTPDKTGTGSTDESHQGVDILTYPASTMQAGKSELHAITGGKVIDVRYANEGNANSPYDQTSDSGWGNSVQFEDAAGYFHRYAHMRDKPTVNIGDTITPGQLLGVIGSTGKSTGEHVHYQINPPGHGNEDGSWVNPLTYFKYHQPTASAGAVQGEIPFEGSLESGNTWDVYAKKYADEWPAFIQKGAAAGMTPAEIATIISTGIWEDGAKKLVGTKSLTATTYDGSGQRAEGIMNWVESGVAANSVEEQLKYIKDRYWRMTPMDGKTTSGTYRNDIVKKGGESVFKETTGRAGFTLSPGDRYADKLNTDLIEGSTYFYQGDLQPPKVYTTKGLAENVGTAVGVYNWLLRNGYAVAPSSYETNAQTNYAENAAQIGTGTGGPDAYSTYSNQDTNMGIIWNYLRNNLGYSEMAAAGVMGNLSAESGYYPMAVYVQGGSDHSQPDSFNRDLVDKFDSTHSWPLGTNDPYGIAQWLGGRRTNMLSKATSDGKSIADLPMQLEFMKSELENSEKKAHSAMQNVGSVQAASDTWMDKFERCNGQAQSKRRERAQQAYERFKGTNGGMVDVNGGQFGANVTTDLASSPWINTLNRVIHQTDVEGHHDYNMSKTVPITLDGKTLHGRIDCTGMYQYAFDYLGYDTNNISASGLRNRAEKGMQYPVTKDGQETQDFEAIPWENVGKEGVQPGDILVHPDYGAGTGHGEIGYGMIDGKLKGWNYGSTDAIKITQSVANRILNGESISTVMNDADTLGGKYNYVIRPNNSLVAGTINAGSTNAGGILGYQVGKHPTAVNWAAKTYGYTGIARNSGQGKGFSSYAFGSIGGIANYVDANKYSQSATSASGTNVNSTGSLTTSSGTSGFTNSSLADPSYLITERKGEKDMHSGPRPGPITKMTWHTWANSNGDTLDDLKKTFAGTSGDVAKTNPNGRSGVSATYGVDGSGKIGLFVDESNVPNTSSSPDNDEKAVTIEIANKPEAYARYKKNHDNSWEISDAAMESAKQLTVDVAKRNGIKKFEYTGDPSGSWTYHRMFTDKSCPGDYIVGKTSSILEDINNRIAGSGDEIPIPPIDQSKIMQTVGTNDLSNLMIDANELPRASTTNVIVTKSSKAEDEMIDRMMNHTYNVRAEQVEILLQQILDKMDNLSSKQQTTTPKQTPQNAFPDNNIPKQIQRLAKGV